MEKTMKLLHLSDLHLNADHRRKAPELGRTLKNNRMKAFQNALDFMWVHQVNYLVIAGDLLDHMQMDYEVEKAIVAQISPLLNRGVKVFYVTGNHDVSNEAYWLSQLKRYEGFYCFDKAEPKVVTLSDATLNKTVNFVGCGHEIVDESRQLIAEFPVGDGNGIWIGMAHASILGVQQAENAFKYLPATMETLESKRYDYFALGHIHKRQFLSANIAYAGSHEPLDISEVGEKGGILVEWDNTLQLKTTMVNFNETQMVCHTFELNESLESTLALEEALIVHMTKTLNLSQNTCVRMVLQGQTPLYSELKNKALLEKMAYHIKDHLQILSLEITAEEVRITCNRLMYQQDDTVLSTILTLLEADDVDESCLPFIPGNTYDEKWTWWQENKNRIEDELIHRMVKVTYEN